MSNSKIFNRLKPIAIVAIVLFGYTVSNAFGQDPLISKWLFNNSAVDETGNHNATLMNGASYSTVAKEGTYSLSLDGSTGYVDCGTIDVGTSFTITMWAMLTTSSTNIQTLIVNGNSGNANGFKFFINNPYGTNSYGQLWFEAGDGTTTLDVTSNTGIFTLNQWNHVAVTVDGTGQVVHFYLNGTDVTSTSSLPVTFNTNNTINIGRMLNGNSYFQGNLDDIRIYNRVLTATEIDTVMNGGDISGSGVLGNVAVTGVSLNQSSLSLSPGGTGTLTANVQPTNATNTGVTWSTSNSSIATVSTSGVVTAVADGTATIKVTTDDGGFTANCSVTVTTPTVSVTGVNVNPTTANLGLGGQQQLTATILPSDASNTNVSWSSSNTAVAKVTSSGLVTGISPGTATITVTTQDGSKTASCVVTVTSSTVSVTGVSLNWKSFAGLVGATVQLTATVSPSDATDKYVDWSSSNTNVATVSASGVTTAVGVGDAIITVTTRDGSKTATCDVTVSSSESNLWGTGKGGIFYNGYVGIGTDQPTERLEVDGGNLLLNNGGATIAHGNNIYLKATTNDAGDLVFQKGDNTQLGRIWTSTDGSPILQFSSGDNIPDLTIDENGYVGIGNTSHTALFEVNSGKFGTKLFGNDIKFTRSNGPSYISSESTGGYLIFSTNGRAEGNLILSADQSSSFTGPLAVDNGNLSVNNGNLAVPSGNLSIGASSSIYPLTVALPDNAVTTDGTNYRIGTDINILNAYDISANDQGYRMGLNISADVEKPDFQGTLKDQIGMRIQYGSYNNTGTGNSGGSGTITNSYGIYLQGLKSGGSTITNKYGIYQTGSDFNNYFEGKVGIGCTNPSATLTVNGNILANKIRLVQAPCSDFVFDKNYNLLNIKELETYINVNKHLPEIPSAKEFQKNGYSVGKMDDLLLRKIEELTLYIIDQNKKIDALQEKNNELEKKVDRIEK